MTSHFGAFGKIPALGDFFRIGLPPAFTEPWDAWVQAGLLAAREAFGADWDGHYNSAPIWRFSLAANLAGAKPVQGVIMCSVDRVGRQFPLTLAAQCAEDVTPAEAHFAGADIFAALEAIALDALE
ncbi:MAG: type VI secretion system-associated protein TagF, partial [Pseudomonadota bacterium]